VKPGPIEIFDIDDTFCAAHGGQQLAFWNAYHPHPPADQFPAGAFVPRRRASSRAIHRMNGGALCPDVPPSKADQPQTRCIVRCGTPGRSDRPVARAARGRAKGAEWCMIRQNKKRTKAVCQDGSILCYLYLSLGAH
jgi:hypothetical protein